MRKNSKYLLVLATITVSAIFLILPTIPNSYEHALILKSNPTPSQSLPSAPSKIDVYFTDPVDIRYSEVKVLDPNGKEVQNNDMKYINSDQSGLGVTLPSGLPNGVYTVSTKVLDQTDGHVTENGFVFAVGVAAPQTTAKSKVSYSDVISIPDAIARFPSLAGQVIVVGAAFSTLWLWSPVSRIAGLQERFLETRIKIDRRAMTLILIGAIIIFASGFGMIAAVAYSIHAGFLDAVSTKFGHMWIIRMIVSSALLALSFVFYFQQKKSNSILSKAQSAILLGIGLAVLSTTTLISHGEATGKIDPALFDFIHNVAASFWIGGVIYIDYIIISKLKKLSDERISSSVLSIVIPRFSTVVLLILGTIAISGPFLLYLLESNIALTLVSIYGKILIIKLALAGVMIIVGTYHQIVIHRHALTNVISSKGGSAIIKQSRSSLLSRFGISAKIESVAGILLIAAVAALVNSGLPATEYQDILQTEQASSLAFGSSDNQQTFTDTNFVENGSRVVLGVDPYFVGTNYITASFLDSNRNPIDIQSVLLELTQTDKSIGPITVSMKQVSKGVYSAKTDSLTIPGRWHAHVEGVPSAEGALSLVSDFSLSVKPQVSKMSAKIQEFKIDNQSMPLYPVYDAKRNVVWSGNSAIKSGNMIEFNLDTKKFTLHSINGTNIITYSVLDPSGNLWYVDPISKILGYYNPDDGSNKIYHPPVTGSLSGLALDNTGNLWMTVSTSDEVIKFDPSTDKFSSIKLPTGSVPLDIVVDNSNNTLWIAESGTGRLTHLDPSNNNQITEYTPGKNDTLASPTALLIDPSNGKIFVTEHDGASVAIFDPLLKSFVRYKLDSQGLPFGMAFDGNHDLWIAQHTLDKIVVVDPRTGEKNEFNIPTSSSFTQWVTTDSQGNIIMAEQRGNGFGIVTTTATPASPQEANQGSASPIPNLGFDYGDVAAPAMAVSLIAVAFYYSRNTKELKRSIRHTEENFA